MSHPRSAQERPPFRVYFHPVNRSTRFMTGVHKVNLLTWYRRIFFVLPVFTRKKTFCSDEKKSNEILLELIDELKPEVSSLMEHSANIRIWITLHVPKIEDGNNFGVSVQEDTLAELRQVEAECAQYLDQISRYYLTRGKMLSKCIKYPQIADYKRCIQELDTKQFVSLRFMLSEIRNHHCTLADLINKNIEKIKKPRSSNHAPMYWWTTDHL